MKSQPPSCNYLLNVKNIKPTIRNRDPRLAEMVKNHLMLLYLSYAEVSFTNLRKSRDFHKKIEDISN
jgi:hypothetical protein